jgi:prepilin-type N-terminal cleavage/methylation domain-containing protein
LAQAGFTLVEMAIVLVLIGLMVSGGLLTAGSAIEGSKLRDTEARMVAIENALGAFVIQNGYLPCPQGADQGAGNPCSTSIGRVPYRDLGLKEDATKDAWNQFFTYRINSTTSRSAANNVSGSDPGEPLKCGTVAYDDVTTHVNGINIAVNDGSGNSIVDSPAYILISHGANGFGGETSSGAIKDINSGTIAERSNAQRTTGAGNFNTYWYAPPAGQAGFDDLLHFQTPTQILFTARCVSG